MNLPFQKPKFTEQHILRTMVVGFALVLLLLGVAGLVAVRGTRAIQDNTAKVVREQLLAARLLNEIQAEQDTQTAVLHQLTRKPDSMDRGQLLRRLEETDRALDRAIASVSATSEAELWKMLGRRAAEFSENSRTLLNSKEAPENQELDKLFTIHDEVVAIVHQLLDSSSTRVSAAEASIESQSLELAQDSSWLLGASFAFALVCSTLTVLFSRWSITQMQWQAGELNKVSWQMLQTQETVARRFSHELHDELGQSLAAVKANLVASNPTEFGARRQDCLHLVDEAIANVRELSQLLRPVILDDFGLEAGLRWLTEKFSQRTGLAVHFVSNLKSRLGDEAETHVFRIAQEALTNIARHSGASLVRMELREEQDKIWLEIEDDGQGFRASQPPASSVGLTGMRARARQAGGEMKVSASPGAGVRIEVWVPAGNTTQNVEQENTNTIGG